MAEPRNPKNADLRSVEPDKTAVVSPPETVPGGSKTDAVEESDRTSILAHDAPTTDEERTVLAPPARGRARVILQTAEGKEQEIVLVRPEMTIGRSTGCDVVLQAPTVSRVHARIVQQAVGSLLIPVGARQNTYVNDELVSQPRLLHDGDRIQLANEQLVFRFDGGPARPSRAPSRRAPMLLAFVASLAAVALIFLVWQHTHPSPAIPVKEPVSNEPAAPRVDDLTLQRQAQQEVEQRRREEVARQMELLRETEERSRREEEQRQIEARVREYVYEGDVAFLEKRYTTPTDGSAVFAYREALRLDPNNEQALRQTAKIIEEYLSWAETAAAQGRRAQARTYYDKASYVRDQIPAVAAAADITQRMDTLRRLLQPDR